MNTHAGGPQHVRDVSRLARSHSQRLPIALVCAAFYGDEADRDRQTALVHQGYQATTTPSDSAKALIITRLENEKSRSSLPWTTAEFISITRKQNAGGSAGVDTRAWTRSTGGFRDWIETLAPDFGCSAIGERLVLTKLAVHQPVRHMTVS